MMNNPVISLETTQRVINLHTGLLLRRYNTTAVTQNIWVGKTKTTTEEKKPNKTQKMGSNSLNKHLTQLKSFNSLNQRRNSEAVYKDDGAESVLKEP